MIEAITFDLWNTLLFNTPQDNERYRVKRVENLRRVLEQSGWEIEFDHLTRAYDEGLERCKELFWRKNLDLSTEEQLKIMFDLLEDENLRKASQKIMPQLVEAFVSPTLNDPPALIDGAREILKRTRKKGYRIGLICNTGRTPGRIIRTLLKRLGIIGYFDATTFSNEFKIRKPDPRIFLHTLTQLKSYPQNSPHVGDMVEVDVLGAKNAGMTSVHFNPSQLPCGEIRPDFTIIRLKDLSRVLESLK